MGKRELSILLVLGTMSSVVHAGAPVFVDITLSAGLGSNDCPQRCWAAVGDYDGDGGLDVCIVRGGAGGPRIFRNNRDGTFTNTTSVVVPDPPSGTVAALFVDLDNDGDQDLALARSADLITSFDYLTNVDGVLTRTTDESFAAYRGIMGGFTAGDVDLDGLLEVVLLRDGDGFSGGTGTCVGNDGGMSLFEATEAFGAGLSTPRHYWSAVLADFNNDGLVDLHAAIDFWPDYHARNMGNGVFANVSAEVGVSNVGNDMGLAIGDIDNDGDLDIFSVNIHQHVLYINDGNGNFVDEAAARGVAVLPIGGRGYGTVFADIDLDGDEDLVVLTTPGQGTMFLNDGAGYFSEVVKDTGLFYRGYALIAFDYDDDGDLDLLTTRRYAPPRLYENRSPSGNWLRVRAPGVQSNRDGIGVRVLATTSAGTMMREIMCGDSFFTGTPLEAHFGLGAATSAQLRVVWPSGVSRTIANVAGNRVLTVPEPEMVDGVLVADLDGDGAVDLTDLMIVLAHFGTTGGEAALGDADNDDDTDISDLGLVLMQFGAARNN